MVIAEMEFNLKENRKNIFSKEMAGYQPTSIVGWELEYGVTDTRRFDDIPYIDEDEEELNLKVDKRETFSKEMDGYNKSMAAWELKYGVTDTRRFDDIPFMDEVEEEDVNITHWTGSSDINRGAEDNDVTRPSTEIDSRSSNQTNTHGYSAKTNSTPVKAITLTTHVRKAMKSIRIKIQKLSKGRRVLMERTKSWRCGLAKQFKVFFNL